MSDRYIKKILSSNVYDVAVETPVDVARSLSKRLDNNILIKREDLQPIFSFKIRGAHNCISQLTQGERDCGVVAASAGNHAQGVAMSAKYLGINATIVMPKTAPDIKVNAVRALGAEVILYGDTFPEAYAYSLTLVAESGMKYIHPFDDEHTIAGQGTVAMELLRQVQGDIDAIFIPVGGGGLIAGMAVYIKYLRPGIKVIGVEPEDACCLKVALDAGERVILSEVGNFAEGVAVAQVGERNFELAQKYVDEVITVTTDEMCAAIKDIYDDTRAVVEPSGACALAGLKKYVDREKAQDQTLVTVSSGANLNFDRLRHVAERAEIGEGREAIIAAQIPERPGSFEQFCTALGERNITEFNYRYASDSQAQVFVGVTLKAGEGSAAPLLSQLADNGIGAVDLSNNEMAKSHVRYMVGGHANVDNEVVYRFTFPERPGALLKFLKKLGRPWNISMFHYRNHGSAYGRVLVAMQVPMADKEVFEGYLDELGYAFNEETTNPAYQLFLAPEAH
ncbi:threonine ammonia-lyase, biosynthetic [Oceanospirillaceae bacterium]|nr:threonine ammonia-lyase, biosynthetic [Oceanospirillaceae bacterium]MDC1340815.1 threonine ammonia-lyase, biosynthetic [Oceanospirillaceae bacterium]